MNKFLIGLFLLLCTPYYSQTYWQQEVNYTIEVKLDDQNHLLRGFEEVEYVNNSDQVLTEIYFHLWPNAYEGKNSELAKQQYRSGEDLLFFGADSVKGGIDSIDFKTNGISLTWDFVDNQRDICLIKLTTPLNPGDRTVISTPFRVKIPSGEISRLGHVGQSYQITQWYPKPAVFDKNGWHQMPYLNQGEFYSEFGAFDVKITVPKNYIVGATGDLQTKEELDFLNALADSTQAKINRGDYPERKKSRGGGDFPPTSTEWKTLHYKQDRVHDFAWFADKRYLVLKGEIALPHSGRKVNSWAMFTPNNVGMWAKSIEYINDGTYYYSKWNGDYPYNNVTAVDGTISAGGGMEYPTITVIGNSSSAHELEVVIVHEVGHNWFYGILGSNERVHGWMDEGMNTLNEVRYVQAKYPENTAMSDMVLNGAFHFNDLDHHDLGDISYRMIAAIGEDQPIETHSACFSSANYGVIMYQKTGLVFFYLKDYLGEELFDKAMSFYYEKWKFKHPQPEDMKASIEEATGKNLDWLFGDLIQTTNHIDYKIKGVKKKEEGYSVKVKNVGQVNGPIEINAIKDTKVIETKWIEPGNKTNLLTITSTDFDYIQIDHGHDIPEINRSNNLWEKKGGLFHRVERPHFELFTGDHEDQVTNIFWTPIFATNLYDQFMLGAAFHNFGVPFQKWQYLIAPMYSFGRQSVSGISEISYSFLPKSGLKLSKFGLSMKTFKNDSTLKRNDSYYITISPYWLAKIGDRGCKKDFSQSVKLQGLYRQDYWAMTNEIGGANLQYTFNYSLPDHTLEINESNEYISNLASGNSFGRSTLSATYRYRYLKNKMKRWVEIRGFAGAYWQQSFDYLPLAYGMSLSGSSGVQDLFTNDYYFGRNEINGIWSQQRREDMGGFKSTSYYGTTSDWMLSSNFYIDLPLKPGIFGLYADAGMFYNGVNANNAFDFGAAIRLGDIFRIYFPIYESEALANFVPNQKYGEKIRFTLNINPFSRPVKLGSLF